MIIANLNNESACGAIIFHPHRVLPQHRPLVPGRLSASPADLQLAQQGSTQPNIQRIYAHPFAHTKEYQSTEEDRNVGDPQIIKEAFVHTETSSFLTKSFLLRYYEEEVQLNDMAHFRVETDIALMDEDFVLEVGLMFYDQQIKKIDPD